MKRQAYLLAAFVMAAALCGSGPALAAATASGTLAVTATVAASIQLVFDSDASGIVLTGAGTNAATLAFGTVQAYGGTVPTGATRTVNGTTSFTYSSPFDVKVTKANSTSANYTLAASLNSSDSTNTWLVDSTTLTTTAQNVTTSGAYGSDAAHTLYLTIPFSEADGTLISNTVNFTATAN
jgi:hypothetical protein